MRRALAEAPTSEGPSRAPSGPLLIGSMGVVASASASALATLYFLLLMALLVFLYRTAPFSREGAQHSLGRPAGLVIGGFGRGTEGVCRILCKG